MQSNNVIKIYTSFFKNLIWDYFCYVDKNNYTIDNILNKHEVPVKFLKTEFHKPNSDYIVCFLKCRKKYSKTLLEEIFPKLHNTNTLLGGNVYTQECESIMNILQSCPDK